VASSTAIIMRDLTGLVRALIAIVLSWPSLLSWPGDRSDRPINTTNVLVLAGGLPLSICNDSALYS
jgi:hypothetical protein